MRTVTPAAILLCTLTLMLPASVVGQGTNKDRDLSDLRCELAALRAQLSRLENKIDELTARPGTAPPPSAPAQPTASATPSPAVTPPKVGQVTSTYETFSEDPRAAARFDNALVDPAYHGYFQLPGTQTLLKIGGFFKTDVLYDLRPTDSPDQFIPSSILIPAVDDVHNANVSMRPTRLSFDFRIPSQIGDARFYVESDFFGTTPTTPRLRHAYAQARNLLVGQTFTNFMDPDAFPDLLDVRGPNGMVNLRNPQVRYGFALRAKTTLHVSIEKPSSEVEVVRTSEFTSQANAPWPDTAVRLRHEHAAGHWQFASLVRSIGGFLSDGRRDSVLGWGMGASGTFRIFGRDHLVAQGTYGRGVARYLQDASGQALDAALVSAAEPRLRAIPAVGTHVGYQHRWSEHLRSNLVYGYAHVQNTAIQPDAAYCTSHYAAGNLIWNPFGSLDVGAEYLFGRQEQKDGQAGNASRILVSLKYGFVRVDRSESP